MKANVLTIVGSPETGKGLEEVSGTYKKVMVSLDMQDPSECN